MPLHAGSLTDSGLSGDSNPVHRLVRCVCPQLGRWIVVMLIAAVFAVTMGASGSFAAVTDAPGQGDAAYRGTVQRNGTTLAPKTEAGQTADMATPPESAAGAAQAPAKGAAETGGQNSTAQESHGLQATPDAPLPSSGWGSYFQAIGILLLILGVLYMGLWGLKRMGKLRGAGGALGRNGLSVEGQFHIGPKKSLVVVRFLNKRLLLGVTDQQINLLTEMEADNDATHSTPPSGFAKVLHETDDKDTSA